MSRSPVVAELVRAQCKRLKMPGLARSFEALARQAREERWPVEDYLHEGLSVEETSRHDSAVRERIRQARFPELKTLDAFDFAAAEGVDAATVADLARGTWIAEHRNVILGRADRHGEDALGDRPRRRGGQAAPARALLARRRPGAVASGGP